MAKKKETNATLREAAQKDNLDKVRAKEDRQKEAKELMNTLDASNNVSLPNYVYDDQLRVYREVMPPAN